MDVNTKELYKQTFGHFCTDAACAAVVIAGTADLFDIVKFFAGYNFLAFCLQPLAGWLLDKFKNIRFEHYIVTAFLLLLIAFAPNLNIWLRVALVGVGNCLFHVGAGALILTTAAKKMMPLGVFVSGGAVGLALGTTFAEVEVWRIFLCLCLAMMVVINIRLPERTSLKTSQVFPWKIIGLLCVCVALRSFMGLAPLTQFEKTLPVLLTITFGVFAGKFLGGILCDKFGIKKVVLMSTAIVLPLFLPALKNPYLWASVQLIVNLSMPITLYLLYACMPKYPAFSFGLAAFFLVVGLLPTFLHISLPAGCILLLFCVNSAIILYAERRVK